MIKFIYFSVIILTISFLSCATTPPVKKMQSELSKYPEYSIILNDMKEEGTFFPDYYHRYKIVYGEKVGDSDSLAYHTGITDWQKVDENVYNDNENFLGMVIVAKSFDKGESNTPQPAGYQYVGNSRYGQWRQDSRGGSFWEFYGKYAFFSHVFGGLTRPVYRSGYDDYRRYQSGGRPYYGRNNQYGTRGKYTQQTNKSFFERRKAREAARKSRFSNRVNSKSRRSGMSGYRSRSGGSGK